MIFVFFLYFLFFSLFLLFSTVIPRIMLFSKSLRISIRQGHCPSPDTNDTWKLQAVHSLFLNQPFGTNLPSHQLYPLSRRHLKAYLFRLAFK